MANIVKYNEQRLPNSIKSGGFNIGVNSTPTDLTGFYNGISPIIGGYTIYIDKASGGPSIYAPKNDTELINITKTLGGNVSTSAEALIWLNSQSNMTVVSSNYPPIVTSGLVLNLDAGFVSSYPKTGVTWTDLSGNGSNGTLLNGPTFSSDNGGTLKFDGIDDYISLGNSKASLIQGKTNFTIGIMFKMTTLSSLRGLIGTLNYGCGSNLGLVASSSSLLFYNDTTACYNVTPSGFSIEVGKWIYAVGTYDGTTTRIYAIKDNVLYQGSGTSKSGPTNTFTSDFRVMGNQYPLYFTNGECVMAFVYNRALSQEEVYQNYYAGLQRFIPTDGLVLSLDAQNTNLYATSPTTAYDVSGNDNNGSMNNGVQYVGEGNGSYYFDGTNDSITIPSSSSLLTITSGVSICFWVKLGSIANNYASFFTKSGLATNLGIRGNDGFTIWYSSLGNWVAGYSGPSGQRVLNNGNWYFMCYTYDGASQKIYNNGSQILSRNVTGNFTTTSNSMVISNSSFNGWLGVSYIYNRALTQSEITTIFNATRTRYGV